MMFNKKIKVFWLVIIVLLITVLDSYSQGTPPVFLKWKSVGDYIINKAGDSVAIITGTDTVWFSANVFRRGLDTVSMLGPTIEGDELGTGLKDSVTDGKTAYGWGDHSGQGYVDTAELHDTADVLRGEMTSGTGGWTDQDPYIILEAIGDSVGIGTATPDAKLEVVGEIKTDTLIVDNILSIGGDDLDELVGTGLSNSDGTLWAVLGTIIDSFEISENAVLAAEIAANAVGSSEIATGAVGSDEIAANAVGSSEIADDAVGSDQIAFDAVGGAHILQDAVNYSEIVLNAVRAAEIKDGEVYTAELADSAVTDGKIDQSDVRTNWLDTVYQPLEATLTDIADGTINEDLDNTANPWADNEVADDISIDLADSATKVDTATYTNVWIHESGDTMSGVLDMGTNKITHVVDPTENQEAATKKYVDDEVSAAGGGDVTDVVGRGGIIDDSSGTGTINIWLNPGVGLDTTMGLTTDSVFVDTASLNSVWRIDSALGAERAGVADSSYKVDTTGITWFNAYHADTSDLADSALKVDTTGVVWNKAYYADTSEIATKDGDENTITTTYMKRSGGTVTGDWNWGDQNITNIERGDFDTLAVETLGVSQRFEIDGETFTGLKGTGLINDGGVLSVSMTVSDTVVDSAAVAADAWTAHKDKDGDTIDVSTYLTSESSDADSLVGIDIQTKTGNLQNDYILKVDIAGADTSLHWEADATGGNGGASVEILEANVSKDDPLVILNFMAGFDISVANDTSYVTIDLTEDQVDLTAEVTGTLPVNKGGTGAATLTDHAILIGSGTGAVSNPGVLGSGQLLIGYAGADPSAATLTEGEAIDVSNAAGSITISAEDATSNNKGVITLTEIGNYIDSTTLDTIENAHNSVNADSSVFAQKVRIDKLWDFDLNSLNSPRATDSILFDSTECDISSGIHPDVEAIPNGWPTEHYDGDTLIYKRWLYMIQTPYHVTENCSENPTLYWSDDKINWYVPFKTDTVSGDKIYAPVPLCGDPSSGTNSDPQIIIGHDSKMYAYWRTVTGTDEYIYLKSSSNGINWEDSTLLFTTVGTIVLISPAVLYDDDGYYRMWTIDKDSAENVIRLENSFTPDGFSYTKTTLCTLSNVPSNWYVWHFNIAKAGGLYVMIATMRNGNDYKNWLAKSYNGLNWTFSDSANLLTEGSGISDAFDESFVYTGDIVPRITPSGYVFDYWYTGKAVAGIPWNIGYTTIEFPPTWTVSNDTLFLEDNKLSLETLIVTGDITVPDNSISPPELNQGANFTWTGTQIFATNFMVDDGVGDSPFMYCQDADDKFILFGKYDAGHGVLYNNEADLRFHFSNDADDYIYMDTFSANVPMISTGGACDLVINASSGEISFGDENLTTTGNITSPLIIGGTATTSDLSLKTTSGVGETGADMHFLVGNDGATEAMTILNNGDVGIGIANPSSITHIKANTSGTVGSHPAGQLIIQNPANDVNSGAVICGYESDAGGAPDQQLWYLGSSSSSNQSIIFLNRRGASLQLGTSGTTRMIIGSAGKVGIGTTAPSEKLSVVGNIATGDTTTGDVDVYHYFSRNSNWLAAYLKLDDGLGRFEFSHPLDVTGNITLTGTVDTVDVGVLGATVPKITDDTTTWKTVAAAFDTNYTQLTIGNILLSNDSISGVDVITADTVVVDGDVIKNFTGTNLSVTAGVLNASGGTWIWEDSAGEPPFWVDSAKYADTAAFASAIGDTIIDPFFKGDATVSGMYVRMNFEHSIDITKAHADRASRLSIEADSATDQDENGIPDAFGTTDSSYIYSVMHPGVRYFPEGQWGYRYWGVFTSLPKRLGSIEQPIIRVSNDGETWTRKSGTPEPLYDSADCSSGGYEVDYFSDGSLFMDVSGGLWCIFRTSDASLHKLWVAKYDGSDWDTSPTEIIDGDDYMGIGNDADLLSPSVVLDVEDSVVTYKLWFVEKMDADENKIYLATALKPDSGWPSSGQDQNSTQCTWIPGGDTTESDLWHIEVVPFGPECLFALVVQCNENADGSEGELYVAKSTDGEGEVWTAGATPFIIKIGGYFHDDFVYRASGAFRQEADEIVLDLFYSGKMIGMEGLWGTGRTTIYFGDTSFIRVDTAGDGTNMVDIPSPFKLKEGSGISISVGNNNLPNLDSLTISAMVDSVSIVNAGVAEDDLTISNSPTDEYVMTWEADAGNGGQMTWESQAGGGDANKSDIRDTVDAWFQNKLSANNTETGIAVTYQSADSTIDFVITTVSGLAVDGNNALVVKPGTGMDTTGGDVQIDYTAAHDFGGATSLEIPNAANPTTDAEGEIAWDSDDDVLEVYSGNEGESAVIPIIPSFQATLFNPDLLTDSLPMFDVGALSWPGGIEIDSIQVTTSEDGEYALGFIAYSNADPPVLGEWIDTLNVGASDQKANSVLFYDAAIEVGKTIYVSIPADDIAWVKFSIWFHGKDND